MEASLFFLNFLFQILTFFFPPFYCPFSCNLVLMGQQAHSTRDDFKPSTSTCSCTFTWSLSHWPLGLWAATSNEQDGRRPCPYAPTGAASSKAGSNGHGSRWCKPGYLWWWVPECCCCSAAYVLPVMPWSSVKSLPIYLLPSADLSSKP